MADNDDVPFNRNFPLKPGIAEEVRPGVRRVLCNNPSPFTFTGTVSYIVGKGKVAIIDPGPDDEAHAKALLDAVRGETVTHIFVTHTHRDHSPNTARIKAATGAPVYAEGPHRASRPRYESEKHNPESGADRDFNPDVRVSDGETVEGDGWALQAVATPGHTANHLAFAWPERKINFVGDHVMGWSTSIVAPPAGGFVLFGPRPGNSGRAALCALPDPAPQGARGFDPASPRQRRSRYPDHGARDLYRHRSSPDERRRLFRAGASGRSGRPRHRCDRRRSGDRRNVSVG
jgi:glyoxylase-like metal-dependent hydrolase (beta-lactamase superfamily II)